MKYLALIMNGMGKSMISASAWRMPKASSNPKIPPDAPTVGTTGLSPEQSRERNGDGRQRGSDGAEEIKLQEDVIAPVLFELRAEHPEREHVEQDVHRPSCRKA